MAVLPLITGGCTAPSVPARLNGEGAEQQVPAIVAAADTGSERAQVATLVRKLDHRDPAVRAFAGEALYRISGQRFGYRYYQDAAERQPAVATYERWLAQGMPGPETFAASEAATAAKTDPATPAATGLTAAPTTRSTTAPASSPATAPTKDAP